MVTYLDRDVGRLVAKLRELGIEDDTIIIFSSDNGPHREGGNDPTFFNSSGGLRGIKRTLHEGGIRVPFIVAWPGRVRPGTETPHIGGFQDFLATAVEIAGSSPPEGRDGISFLPTLIGKRQTSHEFLYWEFSEGGFQQAARMGEWKAVRPVLGGKLELYNLESDPSEAKEIAAGHPDIVARIETLLRGARVDSPRWPMVKGKGKGK